MTTQLLMGSVVGLSTNAINGDVLELVAYKAFNVNNVTGANGDFSVPDKIIHANDTDTAIRFPQADTFTVETAGIRGHSYRCKR